MGLRPVGMAPWVLKGSRVAGETAVGMGAGQTWSMGGG